MFREKKYKGVVVPMVTPLNADFTLDEVAAAQLIQKMESAGVQSFILGTTGEAASLPMNVKKDFIRTAASQSRTGHLYVGISSSVFEESIELAHHAAHAGADAVVATIPSYYALTELQSYQYFSDLASQSPLPLIIYNIPATTHVSLSLELIDKLSTHSNIVGFKDSERNEDRLHASLSLWKNRADFSHFVGWAAKSAEALLLGSDGIIPSTGNLEAGFYKELYDAAMLGDTQGAGQLQTYSDLLGAVYQSGKSLGESLWALKVLISSQGIGQPIVMPPLQSMSEEEASSLVSHYQQIRKKHS